MGNTAEAIYRMVGGVGKGREEVWGSCGENSAKYRHILSFPGPSERVEGVTEEAGQFPLANKHSVTFSPHVYLAASPFTPP